MSIINNGLLLASGADAATTYQISRSLRFNSADSAYLERVASSAGDRAKWTLSFWIKRSKLGTSQDIFSAGTSGTDILYFTSGDALALDRPGATVLTTTQVFRDVSAWYHIVLAVDAANGTNSNKAKLYVNGSEITAYSTDNRSGVGSTSFLTNTATTHRIGVRSSNNTVNPCDMYLADVYLLDGTTTDPSTFAETDAVTGQWVPKTPASISYGTNGFRLSFSDNSGTTSTTLGKDAAGSNNWTPNNFSVASGSGNDSLVDSPTSYGTDTGAGGEVRGNYCTWNPLQLGPSTTLANGNLDVTTGTTTFGQARGTIAVSSGKYYWEITVNTGMAGDGIGIISPYQFTVSDNPGYYSNGYAYNANGQKYSNASATSYGASYTTGDVIGVALDLDAGTLVFYKNGSSQGTAFSSLSGTFVAAVGDSSSGAGLNMTANFGARAFSYQAPSGFKALCDTNLGTPTIIKPSTVMDVALYTGNGTTRTVSGLGFSPDLVWLRNRTQASNWVQFDTVRGALNRLCSNLTVAEASLANSLTSFDSTGFTYGSEGSGNNNGDAFAAFCWDAGTSTVTNNNGSISSQVRANASAGFSVVTFNSGGSNGEFSVGHGLGVAPRLIIMKSRTRNGGPWWVHHLSATDTTTKYLQLSTTSAVIDNGGSGSIWGAALPTSTLFGFSVGAGRAHTQNEDIVSYCFAPVTGYSAISSWVGNGSSDGVFVWIGFRPRFLIWKNASGIANWYIYDSARSTYNVTNLNLEPNTSDAENTLTSMNVDFLSNGFKIRGSDGDINGNGSTYIYAAFAESPFQYARAK